MIDIEVAVRHLLLTYLMRETVVKNDGSVWHFVFQLCIKGLSGSFWGFPFLGTSWHPLARVGYPQASSCCPVSFEYWVPPTASGSYWFPLSPAAARPVIPVIPISTSGSSPWGCQRCWAAAAWVTSSELSSTQQGWQPASSRFSLFCVTHS